MALVLGSPPLRLCPRPRQGSERMGPQLSKKISSSQRRNQRGWTLIEVSMALFVVILVSAMAIPSFLLFRRDTRTIGDARDLAELVMLAKMRAAANFTQARIYADTSAGSFHLDTWNKTTSQWVTEGGTVTLATGDTFTYGFLSSPPTGTQSSISQSPACQALGGGSGTISNTACIVFNSRGVPVDSTGAPTGNDALYLSDGTSTYAVTVSATGLYLLWRTDSGTAAWRKR